MARHPGERRVGRLVRRTRAPGRHDGRVGHRAHGDAGGRLRRRGSPAARAEPFEAPAGEGFVRSTWRRSRVRTPTTPPAGWRAPRARRARSSPSSIPPGRRAASIRWVTAATSSATPSAKRSGCATTRAPAPPPRRDRRRNTRATPPGGSHHDRSGGGRHAAVLGRPRSSRRPRRTPHIGAWAYRYDLAGESHRGDRPDGAPDRIAHDALDRPVEKILADGRRVAWTYDEGGAPADSVGRVTTIADPTGTQGFAYDAMGRVHPLDTAHSTASTTPSAPHGTPWPAPAADYRARPGGVRLRSRRSLAAALPLVTAIDHNVRGQITTIIYASGARADRTWDDATGGREPHVNDAPRNRMLDLAYGSDPDGSHRWVEDRTVAGSPAATAIPTTAATAGATRPVPPARMPTPTTTPAPRSPATVSSSNATIPSAASA